jgi:hypothetical protein
MIRTAVLALVATLAACAPRMHTLQTGPDFVVYQHDAIRVYMAEAFVLSASSQAEAQASYAAAVRDLGPLFRRGVLTGDMFYKAYGQRSIEPGVQTLFQERATDADTLIASDRGPIVKILGSSEERGGKDARYRTYELWVTFNPLESGGGEFHTFTLKVYNRRGARDRAPGRFAEGAKVISLAYAGTQL